MPKNKPNQKFRLLSTQTKPSSSVEFKSLMLGFKNRIYFEIPFVVRGNLSLFVRQIYSSILNFTPKLTLHILDLETPLPLNFSSLPKS